MLQSNRTKQNDVKRMESSGDKISSGRRLRQQQGNVDCHPVAECNTPQKTRITKWYVRTLKQTGKLKSNLGEDNHLKVDILGMPKVR